MSSQTRPGARATGDTRDQEVLRANKELAAYFKGQRTDREARAAVKIIKAFIKERERLDPSKRPPLPGVEASEPAPRSRPKRKSAPPAQARKRRARRRVAPDTSPAVEPAHEVDPGDTFDS